MILNHRECKGRKGGLDQDKTALKLALGNGRRSGIALVIVLGFLVLITVLIVAYFTSVTTESAATKTYANGATTKFLADSAVNIVMGQIANATQGVAAGSTSRLTWASQPGMIRTYDDTGAADNCYKLYSSPCMVIQSGTVQQAMAADIPQAWNTEPALYTDLNAPVTDAAGNANFPIMDGNNITSMKVSGSTVWTYNTSGGTTPDIEGFFVQPSYNLTNYSNSKSLSATNNPVPMPVQWLYVLKDGAIIPPDSVPTSGSTATFIHAAMQPSTTNPITGRIAFWTDDETCKLNINTASEGSPYAFPHTNTPTDMGSTPTTSQYKTSGTYGYAVSPPATGEYNRYPGHPATTCLSVAMGNWLNSMTTGTAAPTAYSKTTDDNAYLSNLGLNGTNGGYLGLTPRYLFGGSQAGTMPAIYLTGTGTGVNNPDYQPVASGSNRLFASFDELMFNPSRTPFPVLSKPALEELKFFLTANSRAPELTPFNTPKVSMWPQFYTLAMRNPVTTGSWAGRGTIQTVGLLAFCSSFGSNGIPVNTTNSGRNEYFFQRYSLPSLGSTLDYYNIGNRSGYLDWDNVPRNQQLASYLYKLGSTPIPGYGAALAPPAAASGAGGAKYSKTAFSSVIIQSLDVIRSNIDWTGYYTDYGNSGFHGYTNLQPFPPLVMSGTESYALPTTTGTTSVKGFGTSFVLTQVALGITSGTGVVMSGTGTGATPIGTPVTPFLSFELFFPTLSFPPAMPNTVFSLAPFENLGLPQVSGTAIVSGTVGPYGSNGNGESACPLRVLTFALPQITVPFSSGTTPATSVSIGTGQPVVITFYDNTIPQVYNYLRPVYQASIRFPQTTIPMPIPNPTGWTAGNFLTCGTTSHVSARSVECGWNSPVRGDWRLLGAIYQPDQAMQSGSMSSIYQPANLTNYQNTAYTQVHSLRFCAGGDAVNDLPGNDAVSPVCLDTGTSQPVTLSGTANVYVAGSLVTALKNTDYEDFEAPLCPVGMVSATNSVGRPGDWDTGPGLMPDGPFINPSEAWNSAGDTEYFDQSVLTQGQDPNAYTAEGYQLDSFSPNRQVASPIRFGSLATGADPANLQPWQTLLFCPNPAARTTAASQWPTSQDHIGFGTQPAFGGVGPYSPPDSIYLEFFTMPVVQPYAISEPLSTAGKVNLNYQLAPFTGIERSTALRGVLKSVLMQAINQNDVIGMNDHPTQMTNEPARYKFNGQGLINGQGPPVRYGNETHWNINRDATIAGLEEHYFVNGMLFRYPSEICNLFLVPKPIPGANYNNNLPLSLLNNPTYDNMTKWWSYMTLTGDNLREEPYDRIYPRVTTKSNTFTVHFRVQVLQKAPVSNPAVWQEGQDVVASECRGSSMIERYIDPNDPKLTGKWDSATINLNFAQNAGSSTDATPDLSQLYKFRVISTKKFAP